MIFRRFQTTLRRFPKIFQNCSEGPTNVPEHFPKFSENFRRSPKITADCRRLSRKTRRCFDDRQTNISTFKGKLYNSEIIDIFTCEDIVSFLSICYHSVTTSVGEGGWVRLTKQCVCCGGRFF